MNCEAKTKRVKRVYSKIANKHHNININMPDLINHQKERSEAPCKTDSSGEESIKQEDLRSQSLRYRSDTVHRSRWSFISYDSIQIN